MITFQENTHFSQALPCTKEEFWKHRTWEDQNRQTRHECAFYITDLQTL